MIALRRALALVVVALSALFVLALAPRPADAHMGEEKFRIVRKVSRPPEGPRGQADVRSLSGGPEVHLVRGDGADYVGAFELRNTGPGPLTVNRVYVAGADDDPRSAPGLSAGAEGNTRAPIPPGGVRRYTVTWRSDQARAVELDATLVIDSDAAQPDATVVDPPRLIGVVATRRLGLARYAVSVLVFAPLLLMALAAAARISRAVNVRSVRAIAIAAGVFQVAFSGWMLASFDPELSKRDGNQGLQFVEHALLHRASSLEYFVGVDGWSIALLFVIAGLLPLAATSLDAGAPGFRRRVGALGALGSAAALALTAQTLPLFTVGMVVAGAAVAALTWGADATARRAAMQIGVATLVGGAFLVAATALIGKIAGATYLVDGSDAARTYAFADVARSKLVQHVEPLGGLPTYRMLWLLTAAGLAPFLPLIPFHGWLRDAGTVRAREAALGPAILPALAGYGLLRLGVAMQPDGARWAAESLPWIGAGVTAWFALVALSEPDLRRAASALALCRAGWVFLFAFSLTPEGLDAALAAVVSQPIATALLFFSAGAVVDRVRDPRLARLSGLGRSAPLLASGLAVGALALGAPVLPGALGALVGLVGSFGRNPVLTIAGAVSLGVGALAAIRVARAAFGKQPQEWTTSKYLEPFGGAPPDARAEERPWVAALLVAAIVLSFAPRLFLGGAERPIRELWPRLDPPGPTQVI